jgi:hypothetical protein
VVGNHGGRVSNVRWGVPSVAPNFRGAAPEMLPKCRGKSLKPKDAKPVGGGAGGKFHGVGTLGGRSLEGADPVGRS